MPPRHTAGILGPGIHPSCWPGRLAWSLPLSFGIARLLGPAYDLRCVLFHNVSDHASPFSEGLGVTLNTSEFEATIAFIARHYTPVGLGQIIAGAAVGLPERPPLLVTFDDAYASVAESAAPILRRHGIPAVVFVAGSLVGNQDLGLDNLVCYVVRRFGLSLVESVAQNTSGRDDLRLKSLPQVFHGFLCTLPQSGVAAFRAALLREAALDAKELAREARLYVTADQLRALAADGFEIGNHTYSHVFCRSLRSGEFKREIRGNKEMLESLTGTTVRTFSVPYGSSTDLTPALQQHLRRSGHEAVFLAESRTNTSRTDLYRLNRVSVDARCDADFFGELEILPRLRSLRDSVLGRPACGLR